MSAVRELSDSARTRAVGSLVASRAVYAYNWYVIGPIQGTIAMGLGVSFGEVSLYLWAFLVGAGIFQIPAGIASLRWGARRTSLFGIALMSVGAVVSAFTTSPDVFFVARLGVGVGAAFFFSPGIGLIARYYTTGGRGFGIGLFNGAFSLGAATAVLLTVILEGILGWQGALLVAGAGMALVSLENALALPALSEPSLRFDVAVARAKEVLSCRYLWLLALALAGFWASNFAVAQYLVPWATQWAGMKAPTAGALDALLIATSLIGGPLGGSLAEKGRHPARLLAASAGATGLAVAALPFIPALSSLLLWPLAVAGGIVSGMAFGVLYYMGTLAPIARGENVPLAVGLINSLQVFLGAFVVLGLGHELFGSQSRSGYATGWVLFGALTLIPLALLLWARVETATPEGVSSGLGSVSAVAEVGPSAPLSPGSK
ncbi:MAG: MFS transporter [Euryarchaeota archaeon]|nr:MFS transporter [Euryarchaeota archaeon]MDE1836305.1 MFS transporter [Euryarchaeota archaeon]MDE1879103.1 MFS transporter [Euryarchaeota archaeon]MDE2044299.1 MFS transporter [Thermoplasmata archaeon]